jgi:hypothetical protein
MSLRLTVVALNKKPKAIKCRNPRIISLVGHVAKMVEGFKKRLRTHLEKINLDFGEGEEIEMQLGC